MAKKKTKRKAPEREIEQNCIAYLLRRGFATWKVPSVGTYDVSRKRFLTPAKYVLRGISDAICIKKGVVRFLEFKTKTGRQSEQQKEFEAMIHNHDGEYYLIRGLQDVVDLVELWEEADGSCREV